MIKFSWFPFRNFSQGLLVLKQPNKQWTKQQNHTGALLDAGRDLNQEFIMPTTIKEKEKQKQSQVRELIN